MFYFLIFLQVFLSFSARGTLSIDDWIRDNCETFVSVGARFELGFFTFNGNFSERRHVGIWYYMLNLKALISIAKREKPVNNSNPILTVKDVTSRYWIWLEIFIG